MTVCVAAICEDRAIFGASDRMLTAGDIEFEPPQSKVRSLTTSIAIMSAGDSDIQTQAFNTLVPIVRKAIEADPNKWCEVKEVAYTYSKILADLRLTRAEIAVLLPLGLDRESFLSKQQHMDASLVSKIAVWSSPDKVDTKSHEGIGVQDEEETPTIFP